MRSIIGKFSLGLFCAGIAWGAAVSAHADTVGLDLSGLLDREEIQTYFAGGAGGNGSTGGPNYGITFTGGATAQTDGANDNFSNAPFSNGAAAYFSQFADGAPVYMDVAAGFTNGFSFWYSNSSGDTQEIDLYSGLDGTGSIVASIFLPANNDPGACTSPTSFCSWSIGGVSFAGTVESVDFADFNSFDNLSTVFSDITLGDANPVPEPASLAILGVGAAGLFQLRRRKLAL